MDAFIPVEYWTIEAELKPVGGRTSFRAKLTKVDGADPELPNEAVGAGAAGGYG